MSKEAIAMMDEGDLSLPAPVFVSTKEARAVASHCLAWFRSEGQTHCKSCARRLGHVFHRCRHELRSDATIKAVVIGEGWSMRKRRGGIHLLTLTQTSRCHVRPGAGERSKQSGAMQIVERRKKQKTGEKMWCQLLHVLQIKHIINPSVALKILRPNRSSREKSRLRRISFSSKNFPINPHRLEKISPRTQAV